MAFMFEDLADYQKAVDFADQVVKLTEGLPAPITTAPST